MTRSGRINYSQNSNRRSENLDRSFSSRVNAINNAYSNNSQRSLRSSGNGYYTSDDNGRRSSYSRPTNYGSSRSGLSNIGTGARSSIGGTRSGGSSGYSSGGSYSGGGNSFSSGGSGGSSGGATVSAGSSGGSSRGNN